MISIYIPTSGSFDLKCIFLIVLEGCFNALGMQDGCILDGQITSSGDYSLACSASFGRLHRQYTPSEKLDGSWCSRINTLGVYLQVDLSRVMTITKIATQGRKIDHPGQQYVKSYSIAYSNDNTTWIGYKVLNDNSPKV